MTGYLQPGRVLVTSGPTRAWIDRVRYIANTSSGALGARIVETLVSRGVPVLHLRGCGSEVPSLSPSPLLRTVEIETIDDLTEQIKSATSGVHIRAVVHAMAVLDYVPEKSADEKRASDTETWNIQLVRTPKITALIRQVFPEAFIVGFKLEAGVSENQLVSRALGSLQKHRIDMVVANDLDKVGAQSHEALFVTPDGTVVARAHTKPEIAGLIADYILHGIQPTIL